MPAPVEKGKARAPRVNWKLPHLKPVFDKCVEFRDEYAVLSRREKPVAFDAFATKIIEEHSLGGQGEGDTPNLWKNVRLQ